MEDAYMAVITVQVPIPADLIESDVAPFDKYEEVEDFMVGQAELQLQEFIVSMRAEAARG